MAKTHENPGGEKLLSHFGGMVAGLPFIIANPNTMSNGENLGYPDSEEDIAAFVRLIQKMAPHMNGKQCEVIENYLELQTPQ